MHWPKSNLSNYLLLTLAFVSATSAFDSSKLYKYDFQGAVVSKIASDEKPQYSGVSIKSSVMVKKTGDNELTVKLDQPQLATFNDVIQQIHTYDYKYKPISEEATSLDKAFKIYLADDQSVKAFDCYKNEPIWVSNFKRGLLSFFNLNLKPSGESGKQIDASSNYYSLDEKSVFGACETDYIVLSNANQVNVTKTRNMAKCKSRFMNRFMPIDSSECVENDRDFQNYKHSNAVFNFNLVGTKDNYVIERALLDEQATFSPFGSKAQVHLLQTKFMMQLAKTDDSSMSPVEDGAERDEQLFYQPAGGDQFANFYANLNLEEKHHLSNIYQTSPTVDQVLKAFDVAAEEYKQYSSNLLGEGENLVKNFQENTRLAEYFVKLSALIGQLSYKDIESMYGQLDERGDSHKKMFWDLMSVVGTNPSFMFMKKLITEGEAPSVRIKDYLPQISFHLKQVSKQLLDEYVNLCKSDRISNQQQYKRTCTLPLASMIHQHCVKVHTKYMKLKESAPKTTCQLSTAEEYYSKLVTPFQASDSEVSISEKMYQIKMAGELGVKPSMEFLANVVKDKNEHPTLRAAAMWNLMKVSHVYPKEVKQISIPFYYDQSEPLELRIAAFYNWFNSGISSHELELLSKQLMTEQNRQLVAYVHSLMKSITDMEPNPCTGSVQKTANMVLPLIEKAMKYRGAGGRLWDSQARVSGDWQEEYGYGGMSMISLIYNQNQTFPSNFHSKSVEIMSGNKFVPTTVSIQAHNLEKVFKRVVGLFDNKESFFDVFSLKKRAKRDTQAAQDSSAQGKFSDVYVAATMSLYGRPITFMDIDSKELKKMMSEDGTVKIPNIKKLLHSFNNHSAPRMSIFFEKMEVFNNEMGLPLYQSIVDFGYKNFKLNSIKFDVEPGFFKDERQGKPPTKLSAAIDARLVKHNEFYISTGTILASQMKKIGVGFVKRKIINIPIKLAIEADLVENKVQIKRHPLQENFLVIKQSPVTHISSYSPAIGDQQAWLPLYDSKSESQMKPFKMHFKSQCATNCSLLATIDVKMEGKHKAGLDYSLQAWRKHLNELTIPEHIFNYYYSPNGTAFEMKLSDEESKELTTNLAWNSVSQIIKAKDMSTAMTELKSFLQANLGVEMPKESDPNESRTDLIRKFLTGLKNDLKNKLTE